MVARLIKIGNSKGIVIPKAILKQIKAENSKVLYLDVQDGELRVKTNPNTVTTPHPRAGWAKTLALAAKNGEIDLTEEEKDWLNVSNQFDEKEWTW
jgi:antitoxin component of MazEF toxin-antitoxin module